ncbi:MAG: DUF721 domain-containing protein [bacterium]|nr:DUF721 domain-containing protein [bacterium]
MTISIKHLLNDSLQRSGVAKEVSAAMVCDEANKLIAQIMGNKVKKRAEAKYVKNNELSIAVLSSVVTQEIKMHEHELMEKLNKKIGKNVVKKIRFLV